jgi:hypothetical protein
MQTYVHLSQCLAELFLQSQVFEMKIVQKFKTHILCTKAFFSKIFVF